MTMELKNIQRVIIFVFFACDVTTRVVAGGDVYRKSESTQTGEFLRIKTPATSWLVRSSAECATQCSSMGENCTAVEYEERSGNCTVGDELVAITDEPPEQTAAKSSVFYSRQSQSCYGTGNGNSCDPLIESTSTSVLSTQPTIECSDGRFTYYEKDGVSTCLHVSSSTETYNGASSLCGDMSSDMYTMKTKEKFDILMDHREGVNDIVWIGLKEKSDHPYEYAWRDGEDLVTLGALWNYIWDIGAEKPSGRTCVGSKENVLLLHDYDCSETTGRFACEIPVPIIE